jgi:tRNA (adenine37-N6)-methyltransferase
LTNMKLTPIGIIHSPHQRAEGTPIQAALAAGVRGTVQVYPMFAAGLGDLDGFERVWLVYWFGRAKPAELVVTPWCTEARGKGTVADGRFEAGRGRRLET